VITGVQAEPPRTGPHGPPGPGDIARRLTGRDYVSYSAISTYQRCSLRYYFAYVAGLEPEFKSSSLVFGGAIHAAIEQHYRRVFEGVSPPALGDLVDVYRQAWTAEAGVPVRFGKSESEQDLRDLARRMLSAFQKSRAARPDGELLLRR
jgi:hypothetical protein